MGMLSWVVIGFIVGFLAKSILPDKASGGFITTIIIGMAGAFVGGGIGTFLGVEAAEGLNAVSLLLSVGGAVLLLFLYRYIEKR